MARGALDACGFPIAILDDSATNRPVTYVNEAFESFFGCRADEAGGHSLGSLAFHGDEALVHRMLAASTTRRTVKAWTRGGAQRHVELTLSAARNAEAALSHGVGGSSDRTGPQRLRAALGAPA